MIRNIWPIRIMFSFIFLVQSSKFIICNIYYHAIFAVSIPPKALGHNYFICIVTCYLCCKYSPQSLVTQLFYLYCHSDIFNIRILLKSYDKSLCKHLLFLIFFLIFLIFHLNMLQFHLDHYLSNVMYHYPSHSLYVSFHQ